MHPAGIITAVLIIIAALLFWRSQWEKKQLSVEQYELRTAKLRKKVRLVFLSDLHDASFGERNQALFRRIAELSPDAVLVGGDMITCGKRAQQPPRTEVCLHLMELLTRRFPVYYAEGNHENRMRRNFPDAYRIFTDHLLQMGVEYIRNGQEIFDTEDLIEDEADDLNLYGVSMEQRYFDALRPGFGRKEQMPKHYLSERLGKPDRQPDEHQSAPAFHRDSGDGAGVRPIVCRRRLPARRAQRDIAPHRQHLLAGGPGRRLPGQGGPRGLCPADRPVPDLV